MATVTYPVTSLVYDTVTLGAYTDVVTDQTLLLGTSEGADDLGRTRVKNLLSATAIPLPRTSRGVEDGTLNVSDNMYITVLDDFRVWAKIPFFALDASGTAIAGTDYKDGDIVVGDYSTEIPPVANCGPGVAAYASAPADLGGFITVEFPGGGIDLSFAVAEGATISTYAWDVKDGTITVGSASSAVITATFPVGFRWVHLTVVDSNGKPHTARCPVLAVDPVDDVTIQHYAITQRMEIEGQTLDIELYEDALRTNYPDGTLVLFWLDAPDSPADRDHMKFIGWLDTDEAGINREHQGIKKSYKLHAIDIAGRLKALPGFPQALQREHELDEDDNVISPWSYMPDLDMNKLLHYLLFWHSTAVSLGDFFLAPTGNSYDSMRLDSGAGSLFQQIADKANQIVPDHYFTCNTQGQLSVIKDWRLDDVGDRPALEPIITEDNWNNLNFSYNRHPKLHALHYGAIQVNTAWITIDGETTVPLVFSIAPGQSDAWGQGTEEAAENEGLALSQDSLNKVAGHRWAMLNSRFSDFTFTEMTHEDFWDYEPALVKRVQLNISADYANRRGLPFTQVGVLVKTIEVTYAATKKGNTMRVAVTVTKEESGYPALTYNPEDTEDPGYTPPTTPVTTPPTDGLITGQEVVIGVSQYHFYVTEDFQTPASSGGPTWVKKTFASSTADKILSWVVDPFCSGYINQDGTGQIDGFVVTHDKIYKVTDIVGACTKSTLLTFPTDAAGATHWRTIQASFGGYFAFGSNPWLLCISYYGSTGGHTGTWAMRSLDGGTTWETEVQVSADYDTGLTYAQPIGVYTSPKTPGFAYTCCYTSTTSPAPTGACVSLDWGETWSDILSSEDPIEQLPLWATFSGASSGIGGTNPHTWDNDIVLQPSYAVGCSLTTSGSVGLVSHYKDLILAIPKNAREIQITGHREITPTWTGFGSAAGGVSLTTANGGPYFTKTTISVTNSGSSGNGQTSIQDFVYKFNLTNYAVADWPKSRDYFEALGGTPDYGNDTSIRFNLSAISNATGSSQTDVTLTVTVDYIILDDGTTYTPVSSGIIVPINSQAGAIHVPWPDNDDEGVIYHGAVSRSSNRLIDLKRTVAGVSAAIGPTVSSKQYGVDHGHFSIRTHDVDRSHVLLAGRGNESSTARTSDLTGVWISHDNGDTWTQLLAPAAVSGFLYGLFAAFGALSEDEIFIWGGYTAGSSCILYSTDGSTFDNREGNLASLVEGTYGDIAFLGIAGGPITA